MKKRFFSTFFLLVLLSLSIDAQVAMGKWRTHFSYNNVSQIAQSDNKIFAVSEGALFSVDKQDGESGIEFYSKLNGLNGSDISRIEFDPTSKQLLIVYSNGNIDLLTSGGVKNIPDLYNKLMSASKNVNQIQFYQGKAYLSCNFGIIVLNLKKNEVADTYYIGPNASEVKVLNTTIYNGYIYALTSVSTSDKLTPPTYTYTYSIYRAPLSEPNLVDYNYWSKVSNSWTVISKSETIDNSQSISTFSNKLIVEREGKLYILDQNTWTNILSGIEATYFNVSNDKLFAFDGNNTEYIVDENFNYKTINTNSKISDAEYDSINQNYWFAANTLGVISYKQSGTNDAVVNYFKPAGPAVNIPWNMTFAGKKLFVVQGGRWAGQYFRDGNVMMYEDGKWTNIYAQAIKDSTKSKVLDFMNVAVDPTDKKHFFVTSYGTGLYEFKNNLFSKWWNSSNSTIQTHPAVPNVPNEYSRLDGAVFDKQGNLLFCNSAVSASIKYMLANGTWGQLTYPSAGRETMGKMIINSLNTNQKWVICARAGQGIIVFDDNGTPGDQTDDDKTKSTFISAFTYPETDSNGQSKAMTVNPNGIYDITQDKNGVIWVGTDIGPFLFSNLSNATKSDYTCSRVKIPRNDSTNLADYLLVNEKVKAIAIDGANRKWIGTESSGVYLMSENGQQTIQHFTVSNSPLLSNDILSIAINPSSGEVFLGTGQGIVSYQSDAGEATETFNNVHAYPNPVREGFTGVITITGLVMNTQVKITDVNGNLVCQTVSNGSIATWDGKDAHGRKVNTGIYLALCSNEDGTQSTITKILVVN